jgi:formylglycine-generating enzyme
VQRRIYPWEGRMVRNHDSKKAYGEFRDNFKRARGDYMGVAGTLNDGADITAPVGVYPPNDFGLYNMAGNVAEWVADVYRPMSHQDVSDFSPYRGNVFMKMKMEDGVPAERDSLGRMRYDTISPNDVVGRTNYRQADNRDYLDGDMMSLIDRQAWIASQNGQVVADTNMRMYAFGTSSLINNEARVVKGGSWKDGAYYLSPGVRRFMDQNKSTDYIGFRCAMDRVGGPINTR